ncbi:MAG: hypothetical protein KUG78_04245 [Kangiellaceae bacterium]|nr:hypothetical protein [Kangiellaceae bacterium]
MDHQSKNMEVYWQQCRAFDSRSFDTRTVQSSGVNQIQSQNAFAEMLVQFSQKRTHKKLI